MNLFEATRAGIPTPNWFQYDGDKTMFEADKSYKLINFSEDGTVIDILFVNTPEEAETIPEYMLHRCGTLGEVFAIENIEYKDIFLLTADLAYLAPDNLKEIIDKIKTAFRDSWTDYEFYIGETDEGTILLFEVVIL